ncbi:hypothetical protein [Luteolibacter luteus]|uniref:Uncharacterized protein n=1 Tax=Luteolibacter luteus TaxID=2728835 RepID=A0A858RDF7_9BACT|nr:hypothetical protein [Luteolibacter luteus]QJE95106.1 hypothetical protein HHL09_04730 [Luteolibacter luteus]
MDEKHHGNLKQYVNDVIGMERDIVNAIEGQLEDERLKDFPELASLLGQLAKAGEARIDNFKRISADEGGSVGAILKEGVTAITGALAGVYGRLREHPVSRMLRDDIVAMNVAATSYSMLLTLGLATGHTETASLAQESLKSAALAVMALGEHLPLIVASELAKDAPLVNPAAAQLAGEMIRSAWKA